MSFRAFFSCKSKNSKRGINGSSIVLRSLYKSRLMTHNEKEKMQSKQFVATIVGQKQWHRIFCL